MCIVIFSIIFSPRRQLSANLPLLPELRIQVTIHPDPDPTSEKTRIRQKQVPDRTSSIKDLDFFLSILKDKNCRKMKRDVLDILNLLELWTIDVEVKS